MQVCIFETIGSKHKTWRTKKSEKKAVIREAKEQNEEVVEKQEQFSAVKCTLAKLTCVA